MTNQLVAGTACSTQLLTQWLNVGEQNLTDEQFGEIAAFADAPPPAPLMPSDDEIDELIASLAVVLKQSAHDDSEGKLKSAIYRKMLRPFPLIALQRATKEAISSMVWMPAPSELLVLAKRHIPPEIALHGKAQGLTRARRQRLFAEAQRAVKDRTADLANLSKPVIKWGLMEGFLCTDDNGGLSYRGAVSSNDERSSSREQPNLQSENGGE